MEKVLYISLNSVTCKIERKGLFTHICALYHLAIALYSFSHKSCVRQEYLHANFQIGKTLLQIYCSNTVILYCAILANVFLSNLAMQI